MVFHFFGICSLSLRKFFGFLKGRLKNQGMMVDFFS